MSSLSPRTSSAGRRLQTSSRTCKVPRTSTKVCSTKAESAHCLKRSGLNLNHKLAELLLMSLLLLCRVAGPKAFIEKRAPRWTGKVRQSKL